MKSFSVILILIQSMALFCQENKLNEHGFKIGLHFSYFPSCGAFRLLQGGEDQPRIYGKEFYSAGITGIYSLNNILSLESGITLAKNDVEIRYAFESQNNFTEVISILYIPVSLRFDFMKYLFATSGLSFDFDFSKPEEVDNQSGIGLSLGTGFNYKFHNGLAVFINPYFNMHSYISYESGPFNIDKIIEAAIRLGVSYRL